VTIIAKRVRGMLVRIKFQSFHAALKEWMWSRCNEVVNLIETGLEEASAYEARVQQMEMARDMRNKYIVFSKWAYIVKQTRPMRKAMRDAAELKGLEKDRELVRKVRHYHIYILIIAFIAVISRLFLVCMMHVLVKVHLNISAKKEEH
jgi:hypothetical protein